MAKTLAQQFADKNLAFDEADLSFHLDAGVTLDDDDEDTIQTPGGTTVTFRLRPEFLKVEFDPPLLVHIKHWYADDAKLRSVRYDFPAAGSKAKGEVGEIDIWRSPDTHAPLSAVDEIKAALKKKFDEFRDGTRLNNAGYRPTDDPDPQGLLNEFEKKFASKAASASSKFNFASINSFNVSITLKSTVEITKRDTIGGIRVVPWKAITIRGTTPQNGADIERWFKEEKTDLIPLDAIFIESDGGIVVQGDLGEGAGFEDLVALNRIKVIRGPIAKIEKITLLRSLKAKADTEHGVYALGSACSSGCRSSPRHSRRRAARSWPD